MKQRIIGICDDQNEITEALRKQVLEIQKAWNGDWEIVTFHSGKELLEYESQMQCVFLDIDMPVMDGIETGSYLRRRNPECRIIIATGIQERYKEAFKIQAFRFVTKPFVREEIEEALVAALQLDIGEKMLDLHYKRVPHQLKQREVWYIKAYNGYTEMIVGKQRYRYEASLNKVEEIMDERLFFRIHRQYIVNMQWVKGYADGYVQLGDVKLRVSRRKRREFEHRYIEYDLNYGWQKSMCQIQD